MSKIITSSGGMLGTQPQMDTPQNAEIYEYEYDDDEEVNSPYIVNDDAYWAVYFEPLHFIDDGNHNHSSK